MKTLLIGLTLIASATTYAANINVKGFMGKTYEGEKYLVSFSKTLSASGEVQAILEEKKFLRNAKMAAPVVRVSDGYIKFYFDEDLRNPNFYGMSGSLEKVGGKTQFCFPLPRYQVDCLKEK